MTPRTFNTKIKIKPEEFKKVLDFVIDTKKNSTITHQYPQLIEILKTILNTKGEINIDYADLLEFVEHSHCISYSTIKYKNSQIAQIDKHATTLICHIKFPANYSTSKLKVMLNYLCNNMNNNFQFNISSKLLSDEVIMHILYGYARRE